MTGSRRVLERSAPRPVGDRSRPGVSDRQAALELPPFNSKECAGKFVARTGYTGEDGFEIILPAGEAADATV